MVFNTALTGIQAATIELDAIGNNIANAQTSGFKRSRAEFADIFISSNSVSGGASTTGSGVQVASVQQSFTQGNIALTGNNLDLAISGQGFFGVSEGGALSFTRSGAFSLDKDGYMVNASNQRLQGLTADNTGTLNQTTRDIQVNTSSSTPSATSELVMGINFDSRSTPPTTGSYYVGGTPVNDDSYNNLSSTTIYDSLGNSHVLSIYYIKADASSGAAADIAGSENQVYMGFQIDGQDVYSMPGATNAADLPVMTYNGDGTLASIAVPSGVPAGSTSTLTNGISLAATNKLQLTYDYGNGSDMTQFTIDFDNAATGGSTQFGSDFSVNTSSQNGYATGRLENLEIDTSGIIFGKFSNGQSRTLGLVQLAYFKNQGGLTQNGDTSWAESFQSGSPTFGSPSTGNLGSLSSGSLEESNVDLTGSLVALIIAQRNFQANAQTIKTADVTTQAIINIR